LSAQTVNAADINGDGLLTPLDALILINYLNAIGGSSPVNVANADSAYDVDFDGQIAPLDALLVVNALNTQASQPGEGEAARSSAASIEARGPLAPTARSRDVVFRSLGSAATGQAVGFQADSAFWEDLDERLLDVLAGPEKGLD
jgi:hypothetical protein